MGPVYHPLSPRVIQIIGFCQIGPVYNPPSPLLVIQIISLC